MTAKSPSGRLLFHDDHDRQRYLQLLIREITDRRWRLLTYCLMSNHLHLLIQTPEPDLGLGFKRIHEDYARHLNGRYGLGGHVFGARFYNGLVRTERHALGCFRYIARNPVEAAICEYARDWPWSGHRALAGLAEPPGFLDVSAAYTHFGSNEDEARVNYVRLVAMSDLALLADIARPHSDEWLVSAVDDFAISIETVGDFLQLGRTSTYGRLRRARRTVGTVP